jgi:hypothetical protein
MRWLGRSFIPENIGEIPDVSQHSCPGREPVSKQEAGEMLFTYEKVAMSSSRRHSQVPQAVLRP